MSWKNLRQRRRHGHAGNGGEPTISGWAARFADIISVLSDGRLVSQGAASEAPSPRAGDGGSCSGSTPTGAEYIKRDKARDRARGRKFDRMNRGRRIPGFGLHSPVLATKRGGMAFASAPLRGRPTPSLSMKPSAPIQLLIKTGRSGSDSSGFSRFFPRRMAGWRHNIVIRILSGGAEDVGWFKAGTWVVASPVRQSVRPREGAVERRTGLHLAEFAVPQKSRRSQNPRFGQMGEIAAMPIARRPKSARLDCPPLARARQSGRPAGTAGWLAAVPGAAGWRGSDSFSLGGAA